MDDPATTIQRDRLGLAQAYAAPQTPTQTLLCGCYAVALNLDCVGVNDDFFDLGGDSLAAERLALATSAAGLPDFPAAKLFSLGTPGRLAAWLDSRQADAATDDSSAASSDSRGSVK